MMKKTKIVVIITLFCLLFASFVVNAENGEVTENRDIIIFENLKKALATIESEDTIQLYVWFTDIQSEQIKQEIEKELFGEMPMNDASLEEMNEYVKRCRERLSYEYEISNARKIKIIEKSCGDVEVVFSSCYAPMCIMQLSKKQFDILISLKEDIVAVDLFENIQATIESDVANYNSGAAYVRDSLGYTGSGIKIGMIELGNPLALTEFNSYFNTNKVHILGTYVDIGYSSNVHATRVAAIMVGKGTTYNNVTYKGIVPNADLYCIQCFDVSSFFSGVQTLLNQGVNVINMSMGFGPQTSYTLLNLWVDHIAYTEDVHFVKAAGNSSDSNSNHSITIPGLSFNIVTVGAYGDSNDTFDCSGPSTLGQQLLNPSSFNVSSFSCFNESVSSICKPDLVAAGEYILYAGLPDTYEESNGTSFAAPQVTAVIAQLMQIKPELVYKQDQMKAILCASAIYRLGNDQFEQTSSDPRYEYRLYEKQGAGVLNARLARYIAATSGKAQSFSMYGNTSTTYTYTIYAYSSDIYLRFALTWLKRSNLTTPPLTTYDQPASISDLADYDVTITAPNGLVAYSNCSLGNMELIQLNTSEYGYGTYTITIHIKTNNNITNYLGLAWY